MIRIEIPEDQIDNWLHYETGFEQCHPAPPIIAWMEEHGWEYNVDWACKLDHATKPRYILEFTTEEMCSMFLLRWS